MGVIEVSKDPYTLGDEVNFISKSGQVVDGMIVKITNNRLGNLRYYIKVGEIHRNIQGEVLYTTDRIEIRKFKHIIFRIK